MKMTREQVAELLLKANDDFSNVEWLDPDTSRWEDCHITKINLILRDISDGMPFRIKDNAVKEVTKELRGKWVASKDGEFLFAISGLYLKEQRVKINGDIYNLNQFNAGWQLVED